MINQEFMIVDGTPVPLNGEKNVLEVICKAGIRLPTFCYHTELSTFGACRMCMFENEKGGMDFACSATPKAGMAIKTNTARLRKYRKNILELLLANHCRDCTTCQNNGSCTLQEVAEQFGIEGVRFPNTAENPNVDDSSVCITRDTNKCILCGDCVRMCNEVQQVGAIDFAHRGSKMTVSCAFERPIGESNCIGCGQCAAVCPTGALVVKNDTAKVWKDLSDPNAKVIVQIAPAVRVALGKAFNLPDSENSMGKIVGALHRMGFDKVFDTSTTADLTVLEESAELADRLGKNMDMPLFSSCCPGWIQYCENNYPELMQHVSTCKSPMQMFSAVIRECYSDSEQRVVQVAVMPCTAKKYEAARDEFKVDGKPDVDYVITTQELIKMIKGSGIVFEDIECEATDSPFYIASGAGVIFGVTGGVTEAVLRHLSNDKSPSTQRSLTYHKVRGMEGVKETSVMVGDREVNIAVVSGLGNTACLIKKIKSGEKKYDFVEVMACPGGCVAGGGQPFVSAEQKAERARGLYVADNLHTVKLSSENPSVKEMYNIVIKGREHELLHVHYKSAGAHHS